MLWLMAAGISATASRRRWSPIFIATARAPTLSRICRARVSGTMPLGAASSTSAAVCAEARRSFSQVRRKIGDRGHVNQNFRDHDEQDGEHQQLAGQTELPP